MKLHGFISHSDRQYDRSVPFRALWQSGGFYLKLLFAGIQLFRGSRSWYLQIWCFELHVVLSGERKRGVNLTAKSAMASIVMAACVMCMAGCTPAQKQTTLQVVTAINAKLPTVIDAADTVAATVAVLLPAEGPIIGLTDVAFDTAAKTLQALTSSYIANPNATVLAQIQAAVNTLEVQINAATLSAVGIKNVANQQLALAALKGLLTLVTVVFALISPTESVAQLRGVARAQGRGVLARVRPYMDERVLQDAAAERGVSVERSFALAAAVGL